MIPAKKLSSIGVAAFVFTGCASILGIDEVPLPAPITDAGGDATDAATADVSDAGLDAPVDAQVDSPVDAGCSKVPPATHNGTVGVACKDRGACALGQTCCYNPGTSAPGACLASCDDAGVFYDGVWRCEGQRDCKSNQICCAASFSLYPFLTAALSCPWKSSGSPPSSGCVVDEGSGICGSAAATRLCHIGDTCPAGMQCLAATFDTSGFGPTTIGVCMRP